MTLNIALFLLGGLCCVVILALSWTRSTTRNGLISIHTEINGDVSEIKGDASKIWGDVSGISGDVSEIWGDVSEMEGRCF